MSNLRGLLQSINLTDVLQLLHSNRKSGELLLHNGRLQGVLYVNGGEIVHAESGSAIGETAAFDLLSWDRGEFEFMAGPVKSSGSIQRSLLDLVMESARNLDTRRRLRVHFPTLEAVPWTFLPEPALTAGLVLSPEARMVVQQFDGYHDFLQVMATTHQNEAVVLEAAFALLEAERLQVFEPSVTLKVQVMKTGLFKKGDHVEVGATHESRWRGLQPYSHGQIHLVCIQWHGRVVHEPVQFNTGLSDKAISLPEPLMQSWGLQPSDSVVVRPDH